MPAVIYRHNRSGGSILSIVLYIAIFVEHLAELSILMSGLVFSQFRYHARALSFVGLRASWSSANSATMQELLVLLVWLRDGLQRYHARCIGW